MEFDILMGGLGGQGIKMASLLLAQAAADEGRMVYQNAVYGGEMRGGAIQCTVIVSDVEVASPTRSTAWGSICMDRRHTLLFAPRVRPGGILVINSSVVAEPPDRPDIYILSVPTKEIAERQTGSSQTVTMVALGAFAQVSGVTSVQNLADALPDILPAHRQALLDANRKALLAGAEFGQEHAAERARIMQTLHG